MQVLVTGGTGFVGSHLAEALVRRGHSVRVLVRPTSDLRWLARLDLELCHGCLEDVESLEVALRGVEWVFHVAGVTKARDYHTYHRANVLGTRHLLEACAGSPGHPPRVVVISSLAASGPCAPDRPQRESDACRPVSHYGISKLEAERIALSYAERVPLIVLRPAAVYGPRDRDFLPIFRLVKKGWYFKVGGAERHLCMIHVRDLAEAILRAASADVPSGSIFFLSDGKIHAWGDTIRLLERIMGVRARTICVPFSLAWLVAATSEWVSSLRGAPPLLNRQKILEMRQSAWVCDISRSVQLLDFRPEISLEAGLRETYEWYRAQGWL